MSSIVGINMRSVFVTAVVLVTGMVATAALAQNTRPPDNAENVVAGKDIYDRKCVRCHGAKGKGVGGPSVASLLSGVADTAPRPRDFTVGVFKFRSTPSGNLPTDEDLFRTITKGIPGFMLPFVEFTPQERWQMVYYIKSFYPGFAEEEREPIRIGTPIPSSKASIRRGKQIYQEFKCWECHGTGGMGDGKKAADLMDDFGQKILPANLTMPNSFKNGSSKEDIYRTFMTGLDGTPMPSYADSIENVEDAWHLVNYTLSLSGNNRESAVLVEPLSGCAAYSMKSEQNSPKRT